jgi:hypothetical protein
MRFSYLIFCPLIVCLLLFSCRKKNATVGPIPIVPVNDSLIKYYYYKPGTYWIYKDSLSGQVDSFAVEAVDTTFMSIPRGYKGSDPANHTQINLHIYQHSDSGKATLWQWTLMDDKAYLNIIKPFYQYDYFFVYPPAVTGLTRNAGGDEIAITGKYDSSTIGGNIYNNVYALLHTSGKAYGSGMGYNDLFYINNDQGIVKMRLNNTPDSIFTNKANFDTVFNVWELQRCVIFR